MKLTNLIVCAGLLASVAANGASIAWDNFAFGGTDLILHDSSGTALTTSTSIELYVGSSPTSAAEAAALTGPLLTIPIGDVTPGGGLVAGNFVVPNLDGSLTGLDLFVLISHDPGGGAPLEYAAIDIASVFGTDLPTLPSSTSEQWVVPALVTLQDPASGPNPAIDYSAIAAGINPAYELRTTPLPEPSASLLGGLAGLALLIRRKR